MGKSQFFSHDDLLHFGHNVVSKYSKPSMFIKGIVCIMSALVVGMWTQSAGFGLVALAIAAVGTQYGRKG